MLLTGHKLPRSEALAAQNSFGLEELAAQDSFGLKVPPARYGSGSKAPVSKVLIRGADEPDLRHQGAAGE